MIVVYGALLLLNGFIQAMDNQTQKPFDALLYMQLMPKEMHEKIRSYWYHQNPLQIQQKLYTPRQHSRDYPWAFKKGVLTVHDVHNNKQMSADLGYKKRGHSFFGHSMSCYDSNVNHYVHLCGPDNTNTLCFVDNQMWVIPTGKRYVFSGYYSTDNFKKTYLYAQQVTSEIKEVDRDTHFIPCALAPDGSRCIVSRKCSDQELWLCDIIMPKDKTTMDFFAGNTEKISNAMHIKKICTIDKFYTDQVYMPSPDSAVLYNENENIVTCIQYKAENELSKYTVDIPQEYHPWSVYAVDYMPNKFVVNITTNNKVLIKGGYEWCIGVYSVDQTIPPVFLPVNPDTHLLPIAPNRSKRKAIILNNSVMKHLYLYARTPEEWDAWILLYAAQQLHKKTEWTVQDQTSAHALLHCMYRWHDEMNGTRERADVYKDYRPINPYYFYWLARTPEGNSNYFRDIYYRAHPEKVKPIVQDGGCIVQ